MKEDTVVAFRSPDDFQEDPLTEVLRTGARKLLAQAVEAEVETFLEIHGSLVDEAGRRRMVRNGYLPTEARHPDRCGERSPAPSPRPRGGRGRPGDPFHIGDPAALYAPHQEPGRPSSLAKFPGSASSGYRFTDGVPTTRAPFGPGEDPLQSPVLSRAAGRYFFTTISQGWSCSS